MNESSVPSKKLYWFAAILVGFLGLTVLILWLVLGDEYPRNYSIKDSPAPAQLDQRQMRTVPFDQRPNEPWYGRQSADKISIDGGFAVVPVERAMRVYLQRLPKEAGNE